MDRVSPETPGLVDMTFLFLLVILSVGFGAILWPFAGAILRALVIATVFRPLFQRLASAQQKRTLVAVTTLVIHRCYRDPSASTLVSAGQRSVSV